MKNIKKTSIVIALVLIIGIMEITNIIPIGLFQKATTVQAYTHNPDNILNNVYEKDGLTILPFILESPFEMIQKTFVIDEFQKAGIDIKNKDSLGSIVVTGNEIVTNTKTYTVLIFGDVDQNGTVNSFDALSIIEHIVYGKNSELKGICKLAANVENDNDNLDSFDALRVIEFVIGREKKLVLNEPDSMVTNKLVPEYKVPTGLTATKGQTLADVKLPDGFKFAAPLDTSVGQVGTNKFTVIYTPEDTNKYEIVPGIEVFIEVTEGTIKEKPVYVVPEGLIAIEGQTLADIELPEGFKFEDPLDTLVGKVGTNKFKVTYTPKDTDKYQIVKGIEISIEVIASSVNPPSPPQEDTEKITGIMKLPRESETPINQSVYYENTVATIKSTDDDIKLTKDTTGNFIYSYDINTYDGDKSAVEVEFTPNDISGQIDIKVYSTKAGTYTIIPKVRGKKVEGTVSIPVGEEIQVTVKEDLSITDIKVEGKLLSENTANEIHAITRVGKTVKPKIEFYHIYKDNKYKEDKEVKIENMTSTPVKTSNLEACKSYIENVLICGGENGNTQVVYDANGQTTTNPTCINIKGVKQTEYCTFDIKVNEGTSKAITRKVNVTVIEEGRSEKLEVGANDIKLYKTYPGTNKTITYNETYEYHIVVEDDLEKYRAVHENNEVYTIIPIKLLDEFNDEIKITPNQISKYIEKHKPTNGNSIVILGKNNNEKNVEIAQYINYIPYAKYVNSQGETIYYPATNEKDSVKAIGIALKNDNNEINYSIEDFKYYNIKRI